MLWQMLSSLQYSLAKGVGPFLFSRMDIDGHQVPPKYTNFFFHMCYESELTPNMSYLEMIKDLLIVRL
jgi:hypothetical protein